MQDESALCSARFSHAGLDSDLGSKNMSLPSKNIDFNLPPDEKAKKASFLNLTNPNSITENTFNLVCYMSVIVSQHGGTT